MSIKRNATAVVKVEVGVPLNSIRSIEFLIKKEKDPNFPELLKKKYEANEIEVYENNSDGSGFVMLMRLKPHETYKLPSGRVFLDTQMVLNDGSLPVIPIEPIDDVEQTLFSEVYKDEDTD